MAETVENNVNNSFLDEINKMDPDNLNSLVDKKLDDGKTEDVAKNFDVIVNKIGDPTRIKALIKKFMEVGLKSKETENSKFEEFKNSLNEVAKKVNKIENAEITKETINKISDTCSDTGLTTPILEISKNVDSISNKIGGEATKSFVKKVTEIGDTACMAEMSKNFRKTSFVNKVDEEATKSFVKKITEEGNTACMTEMSKNFGETSFLNKVGEEATKSFVKKITEKGEVNSMTKISESFINDALVNKIDDETVKSFVNKALEKKYDECIKSVSKNKNLMNKLDEDTKNKVNSEGVSADTYLEVKLNDM